MPSLGAEVPTSPECPTCLTSTTGATVIEYSWTATSGSTNVIGSAPADATVTSVYLDGAPTGSNISISSISLTHMLWTDTVFQAYANGSIWYPTATVSKTTPWAGQLVNGSAWVATPTVLAMTPQSTLQMRLVIRWSAPTPTPAPSLSGGLYVRPTGNLVAWARDDNNPTVAPKIAWRIDDSNPNPPFESVFTLDKQYRPYSAQEMAFLGMSAPSDAAWTSFSAGGVRDGQPHMAYAYVQDTRTGEWVPLPGSPARMCVTKYEGTARSVPCDNTLITLADGRRYAVVAGTKFEFKSDADYQAMTQNLGPYSGNPLQRVTVGEADSIPSLPPERPTFAYYKKAWGFKLRGGERVPVSYDLLLGQGYMIPPHSLDHLPLRPLRLYSWTENGWGREADIPMRIVGRPSRLRLADGSIILYGRSEHDTLVQSHLNPDVGWVTHDTGIPMKMDPEAVLLPGGVIKVFSRIGFDELSSGLEGVEVQVATWNSGWQVERIDFPGGLYSNPVAVAVGDSIWLYGQTSMGGQSQFWQLSYVPSVGWQGAQTATMEGRPAVYFEGDTTWFYSARRYEAGYMQQVTWAPATGWTTSTTPIPMQGEPAVVVEGEHRWFYSRGPDGMMQQAEWNPATGGWGTPFAVPVPLEYDPVVWTQGPWRYFVTH